MKIIEVLQKVANGEIEKGTKLWLEECSFNFNGDSFTNEQYPFGNSSFLSTRFLNRDVELIPPKEQKYRIKLPHSEFFVCLVKTKDNEKEIMPYIKDSQTIEALIQGATEKGLKFQMEFTEQEFEEMEELKPYEAFKELVKDDGNENH